MTRTVFYSLYISILGMLSVTHFAVAQITPEQIAMAKNVTGSSISEDGQYIAYTVTEPVDPKKDNLPSSVHLFVLNTSNNSTKSLHTSSSVSQVYFRPKHSTITFLTKGAEEKTNAIYEINITSGVTKKLFQYKNNISSYAWGPDGMKLSFISNEKGSQPQTSLTFSPTFFEENLSIRNAYIVSIDNPTGLIGVDLDGGSAYLMQWSPNGTKIAISVAPTSSVDDSYMRQSIKIIDAQTGTISTEILNEGKLNQFVWSPDNNYLAIIGANDIYDPTSGTLQIVNAKGGIPTILDKYYEGKYESIHWINDYNIYFHSSEGVSSAIGTIQADGNNKTYIFKSEVHAITSFSVAKSGDISFTANTPEHPTELYTVHDRNRKTPIQRTNNNEWLDGIKLGKQEIITYTSRDKKYDIQGILIYPIDYKPGTLYPLITVVHGGPESHYSNGWLTNYSMPGQMGATEGYMVFYPNYRGSTGRGIDFTYSSQSDLAGKEFDDIVDGVDYLIDKGLVDRFRVGVTGGSYGGYASAWMSTYYSERFAAAVMFVGISNNISKFGTSDIPNEMYFVHEREYIWDHWEKYMKSSPIYHVDKAQTPILIMHGAEDPRVHPAQSMELYRHLKVRKPNVPVRLIYYPGEGHGNARSGSRYDYNLRMMQWFEIYLKTGNREARMPSLDLPESE